MKRIPIRATVLGLSFTTIFLYSCQKNTAAAPLVNCDPAISFQNQVKPLFIKNCNLSGCHDGNNMPALSDYTLCIDASSQIQNALNRNIMPPSQNLAAADKQTILCWISNGSKNN